MKMFLALSCFVLLNSCCGDCKYEEWVVGQVTEKYRFNIVGIMGDASDSGWYHKGLFDSNNGPDETSDTFRSDESGNYKYNNNIIVNIQ